MRNEGKRDRLGRERSEWMEDAGGAVRFGRSGPGGVICVIWVVGRRDLGGRGGGGGDMIWVGLGLAGRLELGVELCVVLRLVRGLELK